MTQTPIKSIAQIAARTGYPPEAFAFVREALHVAADETHGPEPQLVNPALAGKRHVSGRQLCLAMRDLAIRRWGLMAPAVLDSWNVHTTLDFGKIVYIMIENEMMQRTDEDSLEDFRDIFDFAQAFVPENCLRVKLHQ